MGMFRSPKTTNEKRQWCTLEYDREEYRIRSRSARRNVLLVDIWDDIYRSDIYSWGRSSSWKRCKKKRQYM